MSMKYCSYQNLHDVSLSDQPAHRSTPAIYKARLPSKGHPESCICISQSMSTEDTEQLWQEGPPSTLILPCQTARLAASSMAWTATTSAPARG